MIRTLIATAALTAALVGCGSDSDSSSGSESTASASTATESSTDSTDTTADDTDASTPAPSGDHIEVVTDYAIAQASEGGFEYDRDCVAGVVAKFSDADLEVLYQSTLNSTDPEVSDEGQALGEEFFACAKSGGGDQALVDQVIAQLEADGTASAFEPDCLKTKLATLSNEQLQALLDAGPDSTDATTQTAAFVLLGCLREIPELSTATT